MALDIRAQEVASVRDTDRELIASAHGEVGAGPGCRLDHVRVYAAGHPPPRLVKRRASAEVPGYPCRPELVEAQPKQPHEITQIKQVRILCGDVLSHPRPTGSARSEQDSPGVPIARQACEAMGHRAVVIAAQPPDVLDKLAAPERRIRGNPPS